MHRTLLHAGVALGLLLGASGARAADVTAAQATSLENQVRDWLGGLLGPGLKIGDRPVTIAPAGDHFDVTAPIALGAAVSTQPMSLTGTARPMDGGKWSIEGVKVTSPMTFTIDLPAPTPDSKPGAAKPGAPKPPASKDAGATVPVRYTIAIDGQDGHIVWDPSFATPSSWSSSAQKVTAHSEGGPMAQDSSFGPLTSRATLRPAGPDRVDLLTEGTIENYKATVATAAAGNTGIEMKRARVNATMNGVSRAKALSILQALVSAAGAGKPAGTPPKLGPEVTRSMLDALQDFASDFSLDETIDGMAVHAQDNNLLLDQMKLGIDAKSDRGMLRAGMDLGLEGLSLPGLPLGGLEALIPRRVALRPVVSGLSVADLSKMAKSSSEGGAPSQADISAGLESLVIELGGAIITGQGKALMTSPDQFSGDAQIVAENFDMLMQKINGIPAAAQAGPVLIMAKGIGKSVGNKVIWDISYHDGKILVNNVDLAAMAGGGAPPPNRGTPQRPQQNRTR
jgi:hypothetical protein